LNADDVSAEDRARFEAWRAAHPMYARAYEALSATWDQFTAVRPVLQAVTFAQSMSEAAESPRRRHRALAAVAAGVVAAITIGWLRLDRLSTDAVFRTVSGEHASIALPDGSTMELNSDSLARLDYRERTRVIYLERGEAFFKVAHDVHRPFWVIGRGSWVRAVGTEFNVLLQPSDVQVTVREGTVKVGDVSSLVDGDPLDGVLSKGAVRVLTAGEQADLSRAETATRWLSPAQFARSTAWSGSTLYFENQPLGEVIQELGRYTPLKIVMLDAKLRRLPVGGTFQASPQGTEALLQMLQQGFGLKVCRKADRVYIEAPQGKQPD
jgi:transmembrane sensor